MKSSEQTNELALALNLAQSQMGGAIKDSSNPFFKSSYADLTSVIKAIKQPFADNGLSYTQFPVSVDGRIGVATRLMHVSGQYIESEFALPVVKQDPQAAGSAITYARRYALQSIAGIPTADDDAESAMLRNAPDNIIADNKVVTITSLIEETKSDEKKFCKLFKVSSVTGLKDSQYERALAMLNAKKAQK
jgi:hypothetical protein